MSNLGQVTCQACVVDQYTVDDILFDKFLKGFTVERVVAHSAEQNIDVSREDIHDHYRIFNYLLHYLHNPALFLRSCPVPLQPEVRVSMVTKFYQLDPRLCSDIYGKRVKDVRVKSSEHSIQIENVRLVYKQLVKESTDDTLNICDTARELFQLPSQLALTYSVLCFGCKWVISNEKLKKPLSWDHIQAITSEIMNHWTNGTINLSSSMVEDLKLYKHAVKDQTLDAYGNHLVQQLTAGGPRATQLPAKTQKTVRSALQQLLRLGSTLSGKLSSILVAVEHLLEGTQNLEGLPQGGLLILEGLCSISVTDRSGKRGREITAKMKSSWLQFIKVILVIGKSIANT